MADKIVKEELREAFGEWVVRILKKYKILFRLLTLITLILTTFYTYYVGPLVNYSNRAMIDLSATRNASDSINTACIGIENGKVTNYGGSIFGEDITDYLKRSKLILEKSLYTLTTDGYYLSEILPNNKASNLKKYIEWSNEQIIEINFTGKCPSNLKNSNELQMLQHKIIDELPVGAFGAVASFF